MKRTNWKYLIDILMFFCMTGMIFIGILLGFVLAEGPRVREADKYFLNLHRHQWGHIHLYLSLFFVVLLVIHIILNWSWITGKTKNIFKGGWKAALIMIVLLAAAVIFMFWAFTPKHSIAYEGYGQREGELEQPQKVRGKIHQEEPAEETGVHEKNRAHEEQGVHEEHKEGEKTARGRMAEDQSGILITGQMTLREIAEKTGIQAIDILEAMELPENTPLDETLGRLRRRYGFSMPRFREVIEKLQKKEPL
ncbi:MAG: DUF4405 domain-containing protein [Candidatus Aminicenantes bacterium]|nr:DUF4405 domain-containing protein [Candidatus Aminicenantes bacterium]